MQVARCRTLCIQYNWQWSTILKRLHLCDITKLEPGSRKTLLQPQGLDLPTRWANNSKSGNSMHNFD